MRPARLLLVLVVPLVALAGCGQADDATGGSTAPVAAASVASTTSELDRAPPSSGAVGSDQDGAARSGGDGAAAVPPLAGTDWVLTTIIGETPSPVPDGVQATFRIDGDQLSLRTGCNNGGARVSIEADLLRLEDIITTQMACSGDRMIVERAMADVLGADPKFSFDTTDLHLDAGIDGGLVFRPADDASS